MNALFRAAALVAAAFVSVLLLAAVVSIGAPDRSRLTAAIAARHAAHVAATQTATAPERHTIVVASEH